MDLLINNCMAGPMNRPGPVSVFKSRWSYQMIRWGLALVFLYSGVSKLMDPEAFAAIINAYGLIPEAWGMPVAVLLPLLEAVTAIALLWDAPGSLEIITGLLVVFMAILGYGIRMGLDVDCGCFGADDPEHRGFGSLRPALYRDMVMMAGIVYLYSWRYWQNRNKDNSSKKHEEEWLHENGNKSLYDDLIISDRMDGDAGSGGRSF